MTRRQLLAGAVLAQALRARAGIDKSRISAITDEIGLSTEDSIAFAHKYGLQWVELRNEPSLKKEYFTLPEAQVKADALRFAREGLKVSFLNTSLLKFAWPGTEPPLRRPETPEARAKRVEAEKARWDRRMEDLRLAIQCAHAMGCDKVRVFTGNRLEDPASLYPRIADTLGEMLHTAETEKVYLLIENEASQNVATARELADILRLIPSKWLVIQGWRQAMSAGVIVMTIVLVYILVRGPERASSHRTAHHAAFDRSLRTGSPLIHGHGFRCR